LNKLSLKLVRGTIL